MVGALPYFFIYTNIIAFHGSTKALPPTARGGVCANGIGFRGRPIVAPTARGDVWANGIVTL